MPLDPKSIALLKQAAAERGVDPSALIAEAEADAVETGGIPTEELKGAAERMLIGYLPWVKVKELRAKLGLTDRVDGDDELCVAYGIKRGFIAPPGGGTGSSSTNED